MQITRIMKLIPVVVLAFGITACSDSEKKPAPTARPVAEAPKPAEPAQASKPAETPKPALPEPAAKASLGKFTVASYAVGKEGDAFRLSVEYDGNSIAQTGETYRTVKSDVKKDTPAGAETVLVEVFTGGANCCLGYYLLTSADGKDAAAFIEPFDGALGDMADVAKDKPRGFAVNDPAFMYYEKSSDKAKVSFIRPDSPRVERFLVFDNGAWRVDKKGEYPAAYKALADKVKKDKDGNATARAISFAYYSLMAGTKKAAVAKAFKAMLPGNQVPLADAIFADVEKAVDSFSPVENIALH